MADIIQTSEGSLLLYHGAEGDVNIQVLFVDETVWMPQKRMAELFAVEVATINHHLKEIYKSGELQDAATIRKFLIVQQEGNRQVEREVQFYNLDAIISVGYRVNSRQATRFRIWATQTLREFIIKGFVLDSDRLKNGQYFNKDYFDELLERIREIRASERRFYQKITDIYATAVDYNVSSETTKRFFQTVQNKLHFAIHGHTAAEVIMTRADADKEHMGLTTWKNAPQGKVLKRDVSVAKNYLLLEEVRQLNRFVTMYLDYAENMAERQIPMTMEDWETRLDAFLEFNEHEILHDSGRVTAAIAKAFAESEYEKYRVVQDRLYESDFDRLLRELPKEDW